MPYFFLFLINDIIAILDIPFDINGNTMYNRPIKCLLLRDKTLQLRQTRTRDEDNAISTNGYLGKNRGNIDDLNNNNLQFIVNPTI